jgi:hypothetical protein
MLAAPLPSSPAPEKSPAPTVRPRRRLLAVLAAAYLVSAVITGVAQLVAPAVAPLSGAVMWACAVLALVVLLTRWEASCSKRS